MPSEPRRLDSLEQPPTSASRSAAPKAARRLSTRQKRVFALAVFVLPFVLLEGSLRLMGWPTGRVRTTGKLINFDGESLDKAIGMFRPSTNSVVAWPPELEYAVSINSLGLRGPEVSLEPQPGTRRILCLGDSGTFGFYVSDEQTFPAQLGAQLGPKLAEAGVQVEVINGGCGGWSINSHASFYTERAHRLQPHLVVVAFCGNDIPDLKVVPSPYESMKAGNVKGNSFLKQALYHTALYELALRVKVKAKQARLAREGKVPHPLSSADVSDDERGPLWKQYGETLTALRDATQAKGSKFVVIYQPDAYRLENGIPPEDYVRLKALCDELAVECVTPYADFEKREVEDLFHVPLDPHPNAEGYRVMAEHMTRRLLANPGDFGLGK